MSFLARFPMVETQLLSIKAAPTTQAQQSGLPTTVLADRVITTPLDSSTFTSSGITVTMYPSQQDPSAIIAQLNAAGIPCTIDRNGFLLLTDTDVIPTSSDPNLLLALGLVPGDELREDGGLELREDAGLEYREALVNVTAGNELREDGGLELREDTGQEWREGH